MTDFIISEADALNTVRYAIRNAGGRVKELFRLVAEANCKLPDALIEKLEDILKQHSAYMDDTQVLCSGTILIRQELGCDATESLRYRWLANFMRRMNARHYAALHASIN